MTGVQTCALPISVQKLLDAVKANPSKYPSLSTATTADSDFLTNVNAGSAQVGQIYKKPDGSYIKIKTYSPAHTGGWSSWSCSDHWNTTQVDFAGIPRGTTGDCFAGVKITFESASPTFVPATAEKFARNLARSSAALTAPADVYSDYYGDIDEYLKSNSGSLSVIDCVDPKAVDSSPAATLPSPASQAQVTAAQAAALGSNAASAANDAVAVAQRNYDANPSPENAQRLADAQAAAAAAAARAAELQRALDELNEESGDLGTYERDDNIYDGEYEQPEKKELGTLLQSFVSSSPLTGMVRSFSLHTSSGQSVFSAGTVYGRELNFSFSRWEPFLRLCGAALVVIAHGFAVMIVIRGW